jgi:hypothetical protein
MWRSISKENKQEVYIRGDEGCQRNTRHHRTEKLALGRKIWGRIIVEGRERNWPCALVVIVVAVEAAAAVAVAVVAIAAVSLSVLVVLIVVILVAAAAAWQ